MSSKSTAALIVLLVLSITGIAIVQRVRQKPQNPLEAVPIHEPMERERRGTIDDEIALAKKKGKRELNVFPPVVSYDDGLSANDVFRDFSVFLAEPVDRKVYWDGNYTLSWWKFKISETLSRVPSPSTCVSCWRPNNAPAEWLPLRSDEIIFEKYGGTITRDGIQITTVDPEFPNFAPHQTYLLFLLTGDDNIAAMRLGPMSAFKVSSSGKIGFSGPDVPGREHRLKKDIEQSFQNSVDLLRIELQHRKQ
jgi:hypothetical protein